MILIITHKDDPHPNRVIDHIVNNGSSVFRLNTEELLTDYIIQINQSDKRSSFIIKTLDGLHEIDIKECTSVWIRRTFSPNKLPIDNHKRINKHNLLEAKGFMEYLLCFLCDKFSIGSYVYDNIASSKILQYQIATRLGIKVPNTCYSNNKEGISSFAKQFPYVAIKSLKNDNVYLEGDDEYVFFAQKAKTENLLSLPTEAFIQTVNYVQEYIEKAFELRITVVCDDIFACKIDSQSMDDSHGKIDWRQGIEENMSHTPYILPDHIANFCRKYLKCFHLNFGCFDFIVTPQEEYVFLECNPNGQWLWIEELTGLPISESIAKHLILGK